MIGLVGSCLSLRSYNINKSFDLSGPIKHVIEIFYHRDVNLISECEMLVNTSHELLRPLMIISELANASLT